MKRVVTIIGVVLAALALAGVAWAATAQGQMTGAIKFHPSNDPFDDIHKIVILTPILDGETVYVNQNNDPSGDCSGDSGTIEAQYNHGGGTSAAYPIVCAHFSNSKSMTITYLDTEVDTTDVYVVISVVYKGAGTDPIIRYGIEANLTSAIAWVNLGSDGSGHTPFTISNGTKKGEVTVTASQA